MKRALEVTALALAAAGSLAALAGSFIVLPYRVSAVEKETVAIRKEMADSDLLNADGRLRLARIEEDVKNIQSTIDKKLP